MTFTFDILVEGVGDVTVHFVLVHGKQTSSQDLSTLIRLHSPRKVPFNDVYDLIQKIKDDFLNWVIFNLSYTTKHFCKVHLFERTLVADRRGLSRDGREFLASRGYLMKRTLYDHTLKQYLAEIIDNQRYIYSAQLVSLVIDCTLMMHFIVVCF